MKVAPGFPKDELAGFDAGPEFVSLGGELKECVLWFGPLRSAEVRATVLPGPHTLTGDPTLLRRTSDPSGRSSTTPTRR